MKTKSKWLALFMAFGLILAACGGGEGGDTTEAAPETTAAPETPDTTEEMTDTTQGDGGGDDMAPPMTDIGVDLDAGTITVGLLSDLTGPFSPLVQPVVGGYEAKIAEINANGGIHGLTIELDIRDTAYDLDTHVQLYEEIRDSVVALGHSTGSPHTVALSEQMAEDNMFAVPLTWYSGWSDPAINANIVPHGQPYCIEAHNTIGYLVSQNPDASTIAIASNAGDFGEDSAEGAKLAAAAAGLEVVYDGQGKVLASDEATLAEVANGIITSTPDIVWITTSGGAYSGIYGQALAAGIQAQWSGSFVAWNAAFLAPESAIRDAVQRDWTFTLPFAPWSSESAGAVAAKDLLTAAIPDIVPYEYWFEGVGEAILMERILNDAYESGDMTRAGILAAAKGLEAMSWDGLWPDQSFAGEPNDIVGRTGYVVRPSAADLEAGNSGLELLEDNYTSDIAADFVFESACWEATG